MYLIVVKVNKIHPLTTSPNEDPIRRRVTIGLLKS